MIFGRAPSRRARESDGTSERARSDGSFRERKAEAAALVALLVALSAGAVRAQPAACGADAVRREQRVRAFALDPRLHESELRASLASVEWTERFDALDALGRAAAGALDGELAQLLAERFHDAHPNVRAAALAAARAQGLELSPELRATLARDPFPAVRLELARICAELDGEAARPLVALTHDADARVAREALELLLARGAADRAGKLAAWECASFESRPRDFLDALALLERAPSDAGFVEALRERVAVHGGLAERAALEALAYRALGAGDAAALVAAWFAVAGEPGGAEDRRQRAWLAESARAGDRSLVDELLDAALALDAVSAAAAIDGGGARESAVGRALAQRWPAFAAWAFRPGVAERMTRELLDSAVEAAAGDEEHLLARVDPLSPARAAEVWDELFARCDAWPPELLARWLDRARPEAVRIAVAATVAETLARTGDAASGDALARALDDPSSAVQRTAFEALCDAPDASRWIAAVHAWWLAAEAPRLEALRELSRAEPPIPFRADLIELWESGAGRRPSVIELLALFRGDAELAAKLEGWIENELALLEGEEPPAEEVVDGPWRETEERAKALVGALQSISGAAAARTLDAVLARAESRSDELAKRCAAELAKSAEGRALLARWMEPRVSSRVRIEAALGLAAERGDEALAVFAERYERCDEELRLRILRACAAIDDARALELLVHAAERPERSPAERVVALEALGNGVHGGAAARALCRIVGEAQDPDLARGAVAALGELGGVDALDCIRSALADPDRGDLARDEALPALARAAPEEVGAELLRAPLERAAAELRARFAGERLPAREFLYSGEVAAAELVAARGLLGEALRACGAWWTIDGRLLVELGRAADAAGEEPVARALLEASCVALAGEADSDDLESVRCGARALALRLALEAQDWLAVERRARELLEAWRAGRTSERAFALHLGHRDPRAGRDPSAWLDATAEQAAAYAALARGDRDEARRRAARAAERTGRSAVARAQQERLEAELR